MNYIKHLSGFFEKVSRDDRLNPTHVSMYVSLFQFWNACRFHNPISISRNEVMKVSKIASKATYHKCIKELNDFGYLSYQPSYNPFKGSLVYLFDFQTSSKPPKDKCQQKTETSSEQELEPYTNISNDNKQQTNVNEHTTHEKFSSSKNDSDKHDGQKKEKLREKKKVESAGADEIPSDSLGKKSSGQKEKASKLSHRAESRCERPLFEQVQNYFAEKNYPPIEAEKFYNYYESNGWLVSGKTPMMNWQASATNWMLNAEQFSPSLRVQIKNRIHTSNDKNYAEPL